MATVVRRRSGGCHKRRARLRAESARKRAARAAETPTVETAPRVGGSVETLSYATAHRGGHAEQTAAGPASAGTGHGYQWAGGKRRAPKRDRKATPTHAAKGRGRGGVHGKGPPGWTGQLSSIETREGVLDARRGDRRIKDMTGFALANR